MHILLAILKIIGIIILVILSLLLLILLLIMFVPLRYRGYISTGGDITATKDPGRICVRLEVSWLLKLIFFRFELKRKKVHLFVRAAWKVVMQRGEPEEDTAKPGSATDKPAETAEASKETVPEEPAEVPKEAAPEGTAGTQETEPEKTAEVPKKAAPEETAGAEEAAPEEKAQKEKVPEKKGWKHLVSSLKNLAVRGTDLVQNFPERLDAKAAAQYQRAADLLFALLDKADMKADAAMRSVEALETKAGRFLSLVDWVSRGYISWVLYKVKKMISHYRVRRGDGYIRFGTGRPDLTGLAGGILWTALPVDDAADPGTSRPESAAGRRHKKELILETDFYEMTLDTDAQFEGHIRICHVVWLALQAVCRRDTWMMLRKVRGKDPYGKRRKKSG